MLRDAAACPSLDDLRRHLQGFRPTSTLEAERLDDHLANCPRCGELLDQTGECAGAGRGDELVGLLREIDTETMPPPDTVRSLIERFRELHGGTSRETESSVASVERSAADAANPRQIGPYRVLERLGAGGMGVVYRAEHPVLRRHVAIKRIADERMDEERLERFLTEAAAVARLNHPHIIQLYEVGEEAGRPYVVLELARGGSLADVLGGSPRPPHESAEVVEQLALAMQAAHDRNIVHRDLKPSNILLCPDAAADEHSVDDGATEEVGDSSPQPLRSDEVKVGDFGLARLLDVSSQRTSTGRLLGTPSYMAPEQAGFAGAVGPAADIYSLGAILYEMLTGRPPFKGATPWDTLQQAASLVPIPPRALVPSLPRDLEVIALKCLEKSPARRYANAFALADDLRRFLDGRAIQARPTSPGRRILLAARRRPAIAASVVVAACAVLALVGVWLRFTNDLRDERDRAQQNRNAALDNLRQARAAANEFFRLVHSDPEFATQGQHELRYRLLKQTLDLQEQLRQRHADDPELVRELGHSYFNLGQLAFQLGKTDEGLLHNERAIELYDQVLAADPDDISLVRNQAAQWSERGVYWSRLSRLDESQAAYERAIGLLAPVARSSGDAQAHWHLASIEDNFARLLNRRNQLDAAERLARASRDDMLEAIRLHFAAQPGDIYPGDYADRLARIHMHLSAIHALQGRMDEAERERERALPRSLDSLRLAPRSPDYRHTHAQLLEQRAQQTRQRGAVAAAREHYQAAAAYREQLVQEFPKVVRPRAAFAQFLADWAAFQAEDSPTDAIATYEKALVQDAHLCQDAPRVWTYARDMGRHALALDKRLAAQDARIDHLDQAISAVSHWLEGDQSAAAQELIAELQAARTARQKPAEGPSRGRAAD